MIRNCAIPIAVCLAAALMSATSVAQTERLEVAEGMVNLDFDDTEITDLIKVISQHTGKNFIYDERVRGRVTIVSPSAVTVDQAYAVFESVLKVKGFTAVPGPGGILKVIPIRDAKESNLETVMDDRPSPNRDMFLTRLIPLQNIDAQAITNTVKTLVSKDASMVAYAPTNTIIITDTAANIQRLMRILEAIDVETHKEELAVIKVRYADAGTLGQQISEIYDVPSSSSSSSSRRSSSSSRSRTSRSTTTASPSTSGSNVPGQMSVRIITDDRTNSLLVLAPREQLQAIRDLVRQLDVPVRGQGRVHVYYLKHSDAEELSQTLNALLSGQRSAPSAGRTGAASGQPQAMRSAVTELAEGVSLTADPATNSLVIQASKEAYATLLEVIEKLDISRPQVLVEALIVEVDITDMQDLGFDAAVRYVNGDVTLFAGTLARGAEAAMSGGATGQLVSTITGGIPFDGSGDSKGGVSYGAIIRAAADNSDVNILSNPHILTSDNEEAEIRIGSNIPIITSRVSQATGAANLSNSVNVERQDIGVTLRVTPQISEGNSVRLKIFQEITDINDTLDVGAAEQVGVALFNRQVENTVVVADGETVVIGGLIAENYGDAVSKVPWLGDIPWIGWAFKSTKRTLRKTNLLIFLTPHIVRSPADLEAETIRMRERFELASGETISNLDVDMDIEQGDTSLVRRQLIQHSRRYPASRIEELAKIEADKQAAIEVDALSISNYLVRAGVYSDVESAKTMLTVLIDAGFEGALLSMESDGQVIYELQIGPFQELLQAKYAAEILREAHRLTPAITLIEEAPE